tara:strand:- start:238 stop:471 length:234 start_codon:yes stop_codon:yes gene_type:complete
VRIFSLYLDETPTPRRERDESFATKHTRQKSNADNTKRAPATTTKKSTAALFVFVFFVFFFFFSLSGERERAFGRRQ